jgi:hypothetical protein
MCTNELWRAVKTFVENIVIVLVRFGWATTSCLGCRSVISSTILDYTPSGTDTIFFKNKKFHSIKWIVSCYNMKTLVLLSENVHSIEWMIVCSTI